MKLFPKKSKKKFQSKKKRSVSKLKKLKIHHTLILFKIQKHEQIFLTEGDKKIEEINTQQTSTENLLSLRSDLSLKSFLKYVGRFSYQ